MNEDDLFCRNGYMPENAREAALAGVLWRRPPSPLSSGSGSGQRRAGCMLLRDAPSEEPPAKRQAVGAGKAPKRSGGGTKRKSASAAKSQERRAEQKPLPPGWHEELRMPQSGRQYRVYIGPATGQYAESRSKAWEAYERIQAGPDALGLYNGKGRGPGSGRRVCLACDHNRKRKCTCGKRSRRW
jgi:hypothetical protein